MTHFDVFNGDADGILALLQLRKAEPKNSVKVTGIKRDIALLRRVNAQKGDSITVLDVSMEKNMEALIALLDSGVPVFYADHHRSGEIPDSELLDAHIDLSADTCTSLLINQVLKGQYKAWAIAAAYGDNLVKRADELASEYGYSHQERDFLKELGTLINYNGYGAAIDDLHYHPADLFQRLMCYDTPFELQDDETSPYYVLKAAYEQDMAEAKSSPVFYDADLLKVIVLPNEAWSRRVSGVFGNDLANQTPDKAHLVLTDNNDGHYTVSLRAPLANKQGADEICSSFATGGGRKGAAGINALPFSHLDKLISLTQSYYDE
ncbi:DHH family phosphoesterase [Photobacterium sp. TLY01]|uniref:DHH family phosphoesterase n=1 Tax=Photobacterium sp. TLY01 TaxID=2907534 RepID=UPI001F3412A2|nr:DHH family phosphoesterase [Photobacterium sp. TLY01]UIP29525.1 DHH family phosphoesterase [Photobacterium sp. TLY01]